MTAPFEVVVALGNEPVEPIPLTTVGPLVMPLLHVSRPEIGDGSAASLTAGLPRYGSLVRWLVVARDGTWLAAGTANWLSRGQGHVIAGNPSDIPSGSWSEILLALGRARLRWDQIRERERDRANWLNTKRAQLRIAERRRAEIEQEITRLSLEITETLMDLPVDPERIDAFGRAVSG